MKGKFLMVLALAVAPLIVSGPLSAHHGNASFDSGKSITMKGTVTQWIWSNPHCLLRYDVKDEKGEVVHWIAETQAPISMTPDGWKQQSFKPGDEITITVEPMKTGRPAGRIMLVVFPDGSKLKGQTTFKEDQYARP